METPDQITVQTEGNAAPAMPAVPSVLVAFAWTYGAGDSILVNAYADHPDGRLAIDDARYSHENCAERDDGDVSKPTPIHTYIRTDASVDALVAAAVKAERVKAKQAIERLQDDTTGGTFAKVLVEYADVQLCDWCGNEADGHAHPETP